jgi:hypothetical protein
MLRLQGILTLWIAVLALLNAFWRPENLPYPVIWVVTRIFFAPTLIWRADFFVIILWLRTNFLPEFEQSILCTLQQHLKKKVFLFLFIFLRLFEYSVRFP